MNLRYNKTGKPIDLEEWAKLMEDDKYRLVKQDYTPNRKFFVSTVWLGLDHDFGFMIRNLNPIVNPHPLIFETMVFSGENHNEIFGQWRYSTEEEARKYHEKMVRKFTRKEKRLHE